MCLVLHISHKRAQYPLFDINEYKQFKAYYEALPQRLRVAFDWYVFRISDSQNIE